MQGEALPPSNIIYFAGVVSVLFEKESEGSVLHIHSESMRQPSRQAFVRMLGSRGGVGISPLHPRALDLHGAQLWSFPLSISVFVVAARSISRALPNQWFGSRHSARAPARAPLHWPLPRNRLPAKKIYFYTVYTSTHTQKRSGRAYIVLS